MKQSGIGFIGVFAVVAVTMTSRWAYAIEFEKAPSSAVVQTDDGEVVTLEGTSYQLWHVPNNGTELEEFPAVPEKYRAIFLRVSPGTAITADDAAKIIEGYYRETAFDVDSMKVRKLAVAGPMFITLCDNYLFKCLKRSAHAGYLVTFEINGKNRAGGMTGFEGRSFLFTRLPAQQASADSAAVSTVKGRIPVATEPQLESILGDGYVVTTDKAGDQLLQAARSELVSEGYILSQNSTDKTVVTAPRTMRLTAKDVDCGKIAGISVTSDKRLETTELVAVTVGGNMLRVQVAVDGIQRIDMPSIAGGGAADNPVACNPSEQMGRDIADKIVASIR